MKGGIFYGLRAKQLSLFFIAVVCTTILIWAWEKTPILTSLLPPQNHVWQMFPDQIHHTQVPKGGNNSEQADESMNLVAPVYSTNTSYFLTENAKQNSGTVRGENQEISANFKDESDIKQVSSKRKNSSKQAEPDLVAPINSLSPDSSTISNNNLATHVKNEETSEIVKEEPDIKQVSESKNSSKEAVLDLLAPTSSQRTKSLARGNNNLTTPVKNQACNYGKGKWVDADNRPLYSGSGCKQWLSGMWACRLTQRTDFAYEKLRWQPKDCEMDDFTGSKFLMRMRNKTLAFVGDSLGRQQFQSLMCMITAGEWRPDVSDVGREYGLVKPRGAVRPDGWAYRFPTTNTTILYYWSASLCDIEPIDPTNPATNYAMHLDRPPAFLRRYLPQFDVLVLNTGHHWNRGKLNANRWIMHVGGVPNTNRKIADIAGAKNFTIYSIVDWVNSQLPKYPGLKAFYRSISPRHFFNGDWNTGGTCDNTTPLSGGKEVLEDESVDPLAAGAVKGKKVKILDITALSQLRDEGHISRYSIKATPGMQDCLHWCMPGVPDAWNEILFAQI